MKKLTLAFVALVLFTLASITADAANILVNGDFETVDESVGLIHGIRLDDLGADGWDVYDSIPGWRTTAGNGIEVQHDFAVGDAHSPSHKVELDSHPGPGSNSSMMSNGLSDAWGLTYVGWRGATLAFVELVLVVGALWASRTRYPAYR